ncbi:transposase domain-containing protein [Streptomyces sp. NPDC014894]|uniref:transposase domain-containing protein n=1 Tax=Streptomyces sp. NPDC014894 TaxID=3364931 RepID=UPI0036F86D4C
MLISRLERLGLGVLTRSFPPELVDRVVGEAGCSEKRRRLLSARFTVYFVLALCLFPRVDYLEVLRLVKAGEAGLREWPGVNKSSLTRARQRLGWQTASEHTVEPSRGNPQAYRPGIRTPMGPASGIRLCPRNGSPTHGSGGSPVHETGEPPDH